MLWFFAAEAAIGVALWVAVRFEDGLVPARDRAARAAGQPRRCPCRRRPPAEAARASSTRDLTPSLRNTWRR